MFVTLEGIVMVLLRLIPEKALSPMLFTPFDIVTFESPLQPPKALFPMFTTPPGIVKFPVSPLHPQKALSPMLSTLSGIVMLVSPLHL